MTARCVRCGAPTDAAVCRPEALRLAEALQIAAGHAEDADAVLGRQTRYGTGSRGGSSGGLTPNPKLVADYGAVDGAVGGWIRILVDEGYTSMWPARWQPTEGPLCPPARPGDEPRKGNRCDHDSCTAIRAGGPPPMLARSCLRLADLAGELRKHPDAGAAFRELHDACDQLARLVDRPADKELVGMCDCGKVLYAARGRSAVQCPQPTCRLVWNVRESRDILGDALRGKLLTAAEAARLAAHWDERSSEQIRKLINKWAERGRLAPHATVGDDPAFLFGEVLDRLAESPPRRAATAA